MILKRYLAREITLIFFAILFVLLAIFIGNQMIALLNKISDGRLAATTLFTLLLLELPHLAGLLMPGALFIAILLGFGRLYANHEMVILTSVGWSLWQQFTALKGLILCVFSFILILNFWLTPLILRHEQMLAHGVGTTLLDTVVPQRFQTLGASNHVLYVESLSRDRSTLKNIFFAEKLEQLDDAGKVQTAWAITLAQSGKAGSFEKNPDAYLIGNNGNRYIGIPGNHNYRILHYQKYAIRLDQNNMLLPSGVSTLPMLTLWRTRHVSAEHWGELHWRLAVPISLILLTLLAIPFSVIAPRAGRFKKMVPAILIYAVYTNFILVLRAWINAGVMPAVLGMWPLHLAMLMYVAYEWRSELQQRFWQRKFA